MSKKKTVKNIAKIIKSDRSYLNLSERVVVENSSFQEKRRWPFFLASSAALVLSIIIGFAIITPIVLRKKANERLSPVTDSTLYLISHTVDNPNIDVDLPESVTIGSLYYEFKNSTERYTRMKENAEQVEFYGSPLYTCFYSTKEIYDYISDYKGMNPTYLSDGINLYLYLEKAGETNIDVPLLSIDKRLGEEFELTIGDYYLIDIARFYSCDKYVNADFIEHVPFAVEDKKISLGTKFNKVLEDDFIYLNMDYSFTVNNAFSTASFLGEYGHPKFGFKVVKKDNQCVIKESFFRNQEMAAGDEHYYDALDDIIIEEDEYTITVLYKDFLTLFDISLMGGE